MLRVSELQGEAAMSTTPAASAQSTVRLPTPQVAPELALESTLRRRAGAREFRPDPIPLREVSSLLWAGFGLNRAGHWGRTAPCPCWCGEITVVAVLPGGAYRYRPHEHCMDLASPADLRMLAGGGGDAGAAPLTLLYVIGMEPDPEDDEEHGRPAGADIGCIVENVSLYCTGAGLASVLRGVADPQPLAEALGLEGHQRIALAQSIGYLRGAPRH